MQRDIAAFFRTKVFGDISVSPLLYHKNRSQSHRCKTRSLQLVCVYSEGTASDCQPISTDNIKINFDFSGCKVDSAADANGRVSLPSGPFDIVQDSTPLKLVYREDARPTLSQLHVHL